MTGNRSKCMKAQTMIFEQVILFAIGVVIFIICFATFNVYQDYFTSASMNDQLGQMKSWISSNIISLIENGDANSSIILDVPRKIGEEEYEVMLSDAGIRITSLVTHTRKESILFNLSTSYNLSGSVTSTGRKFIIYKKGNEIIIS
jgi:hypothetical protein